VVAAVVDAADGADAVIGDAVATMLVEIVVPGDRDAIVGVDGNRGRVVERAVSPGVVRVAVDRAHAVLAHAHVGGAAAATGLVDHLEAGGAAIAGGQCNRAFEQTVADALGLERIGAAALVATGLGRVHLVPLGEDRTVAGVDDVVHFGRGLVG